MTGYHLKVDATTSSIDDLTYHLREIAKKLEEGYKQGADGGDVFWDLEEL